MTMSFQCVRDAPDSTWNMEKKNTNPLKSVSVLMLESARKLQLIVAISAWKSNKTFCAWIRKGKIMTENP